MSTAGRNVYAHILIVGDEFSPRLAEKLTGLKFSEQNERGDIGTLGRYRGKPLPYGSARYDIADHPTTSDLLSPDLEIFSPTTGIAQLSECGATEITLFINVGFSGQCNFELSPQLLTKLASLRIPVAISCYEQGTD